MRLGDGRLVVSPYFAEKHAVSWWTTWLADMGSRGQGVALFPVLQDDQTWGDDFAPISYGIGNWGSRNPAWNPPAATFATSPRGRIAAVHARGDLWMQPVSVQDERPRSGVFDEAANTRLLRDTWAIARDAGADWVLLPTWNDYAEGSAIAPSAKHGDTFLDLMAYYISWFKSGAAPTISRDGVYLTHRTQLAGADPTYPQTTLMSLRGGTPAQDTVEALSFLTAPATVSLSVGGVTTTCAAPAGVASCMAPLRPGTVSVSVARSGSAVTSVTSPYVVDASPYVQDLQYVGVSSLRTGTSAAPVAASTTPRAPDPALPTATSPAAPAASAPSTAVPPPTTPTMPSTPPMPSTAPGTSVVAPAKPTVAPAPPPSAPSPTGAGPTTSPPAGPRSTSTSIALATWSPSAAIASQFTVLLSPSAAGTLRLQVDGRTVSTAAVSAGGVLSLGTGLLPRGTYVVTALFTPGDPTRFGPSSSLPARLVIP
jgi:hypothetical protein